MRVGFLLGGDGFAAVLYERDLADARLRSPWFRSSDDAMVYGQLWAGRLGVPVDIVRVDVRLLGAAS